MRPYYFGRGRRIRTRDPRFWNNQVTHRKTSSRPARTLYNTGHRDVLCKKGHINAQWHHQRFLPITHQKLRRCKQIKERPQKTKLCGRCCFFDAVANGTVGTVGIIGTRTHLFTLHYYLLLAKNPAVLVKSEELRVKK